MKLKVTVDGKVYEVEVEVAPEPPPTLPTFLVQVGISEHAAGYGAGAAGGALAEEMRLTKKKCAAARCRESW